MENEKEVISAIQPDKELFGKKIKAIPLPSKDANSNTKDIANKIAEVGDISKIDMSEINEFTQLSQDRETLYSMLDTMANDPTVSAVLETYAEDATEYNEDGKIIWAESEDTNIKKQITYYLESLNVDKNAYKWVYSLIKYGDIYWQLFRESDYKKDDFFNVKEDDKKLNEDIKINISNKLDPYAHYIESVENPATIFELSRFGKTSGFIKSDIQTTRDNKQTLINQFNQYRFKKDDITIYNSDMFAHACLENNNSRTTEEVKLFIDDNKLNADDGTTYKVKRGQSLLYNVFKIWRELSLLENSMLLSRVTKSSILRVISVEIGDMPKEDVESYLRGIKSMIEQKTALDEGKSMSDYTNPGPIENNIYVPTRDGKGAITTSEVGGDVNVGQLSDIDYFTNKYYGALRVPKQYFGFTDDGAGFSGGQSLAIISSRYAKAVKRIQNALIQGITDIINLFLIDKGLISYIGKFTIKMQSPTTQEEIDRRDNTSSKVQIASDIMNLVADIEDPSIKLKILKSLLSKIVSDSNICDLIQEEIAKLETEESDNQLLDNEEEQDNAFNRASGGGPRNSDTDTQPLNLDTELDLDTELSGEEPNQSENEEDILPTPSELGGGDFTDNDLDI